MEIIQTFNKDSKALNVYGSFEDPLFLAKDVGTILEMENIRVQLGKIDESWKVVKKTYTPGGAQNMTYLREPGLYWLVMRSSKPEAKCFQKWIVEDVIPSIRKTGQYTLRNHPVQKRVTFKIENEMDLQSKVVNFLRNRYPDSLFICTLGELQDTPQKRLNSYKMGYMKGIPDLLITNLHKKFAGFAIEFKTPRGTGIVSPDQESMLDRYKENNWKTLLTNDYDDCIVQLVDYFEGVRVKCEHCSMKFKSKKTIKNHHKYFHKIEN